MYINLKTYQEFEILFEHEYSKGLPFELIIETREMETAGLAEVYSLSKMLNRIRTKTTLLKSTVIYVHSSVHSNLLYFLFTYLSSPIAVVHVIHGSDHKTFYPPSL